MSVLLEERIYRAETVANAAKSTADQATQKIVDHEKLCADRYNNITSSIARLEGIIKWAGVTGFGIIMTALGWLAVQQWTLVQDRLSAVETNHVEPPKQSLRTD